MNATRLGIVVLLAVLQSGCALAMVNGAANSGGSSSSSGSSGSTSTSSAPVQPAVSDDAISTSVRSRFAANSALKTLNLSVGTHDGVVTLRGQVAKVDQRTAAETQARAVRGVKSVQNLIVVR